MTPRPRPGGTGNSTGGGLRRRTPAPPRGPVVDLAAHRILRALAGRARYKYVTPRLAREGSGWKVISPNCSRNIDRQGGEVDIAWFEPQPGGRWRLHARDHTQRCWILQVGDATLAQALAMVCDDPGRVFWP